MNTHFNHLAGQKLLKKYFKLTELGLHEKAEACLTKAAMFHQYPPAIRQISFLTLHGHGRQPPDKEMAIHGFRSAARRGDTFSNVLLEIFHFTLSASYPHTGRWPTARRITLAA